MGTMAVFGRVNVALEKVENLGVSLSPPHPNEETPTEPSREGDPASKELKLARVFTPITRKKKSPQLHDRAHQVSISAVANWISWSAAMGSGKSTLAKIITRVYILPESGAIHLDGRPITNENRNDYRQLFSVVFSDFYLFEDLLGLDTDSLDAPNP